MPSLEDVPLALPNRLTQVSVGFMWREGRWPRLLASAMGNARRDGDGELTTRMNLEPTFHYFIQLGVNVDFPESEIPFPAPFFLPNSDNATFKIPILD